MSNARIGLFIHEEPKHPVIVVETDKLVESTVLKTNIECHIVSRVLSSCDLYDANEVTIYTDNDTSKGVAMALISLGRKVRFEIKNKE